MGYGLTRKLSNNDCMNNKRQKKSTMGSPVRSKQPLPPVYGRPIDTKTWKEIAGVQICCSQKLEPLFEVARRLKAMTVPSKKYSTENDYETKWYYLDLDLFIDVHGILLKDLCQQRYVMNIGLLDSALQRPKFMFFYNKASLFKMAAGLGESIIKNHTFLDGNKRAGHLAISMFLLLNGYDLFADEDSAEHIILNVAMGKINIDMLESWIASNVKACE
ncbi:19173_t:CDS:2 [Funneliformis geosporum]|uniref:18888_t:CDS:1 n=1 Tax=Funneliformis geosporum TaxID=1117311 RepID=A0A9W4SS03_9GLOM|nr:18888_t:CDS:2 [Funneliformis geosporum]CAI2181015.1 19173_t:CDS:2 [Funneliformis geosporum]